MNNLTNTKAGIEHKAADEIIADSLAVSFGRRKAWLYCCEQFFLLIDIESSWCFCIRHLVLPPNFDVNTDNVNPCHNINDKRQQIFKVHNVTKKSAGNFKQNEKKNDKEQYELDDVMPVTPAALVVPVSVQAVNLLVKFVTLDKKIRIHRIKNAEAFRNVTELANIFSVTIHDLFSSGARKGLWTL